MRHVLRTLSFGLPKLSLLAAFLFKKRTDSNAYIGTETFNTGDIFM